MRHSFIKICEKIAKKLPNKTEIRKKTKIYLNDLSSSSSSRARLLIVTTTISCTPLISFNNFFIFLTTSTQNDHIYFRDVDTYEELVPEYKFVCFKCLGCMVPKYETKTANPTNWAYS